MVKNFIIAALLLCVGCASNENPKSWREVYAEYIQKICKEDSGAKFALIKLDNDDVPEIYYSCDIFTSPVNFEKLGIFYPAFFPETRDTVATYYDGKLIIQGFSSFINSYIESSGMICTRDGYFDHGLFRIIELKHGKFETIAERSYGFSDTDFYEWNGKQVSKTEYDKEIDKIFDSNCSCLPKTYSAYEVLKQLREKPPKTN